MVSLPGLEGMDVLSWALVVGMVDAPSAPGVPGG